MVAHPVTSRHRTIQIPAGASVLDCLDPGRQLALRFFREGHDTDACRLLARSYAARLDVDERPAPVVGRLVGFDRGRDAQ